MKFQPGNNYGRPKGQVNKTTKEIRELISTLLNNELSKLEDYKDQMSPKEWIELLIKLMPYTVPKMPTEILTNEAPPLQAVTVQIVKSDYE